VPIKKSKTLFTYSKTVFYKKGSVSFRFSSEGLLNALVAESQILFEVKCVEKYSADFYVEMAIKNDNPFSFQQGEYIWQDNCFDKVKGAIVAYTQGVVSTTDADTQVLVVQIKELKNSFAGLNTSIMVNGSSVANAVAFIRAIKECQKLYTRKISTTTNLFDILVQQFREVVNLASMREQEIRRYKSSDNSKQIEKLQKEKEELENKLFEMEVEENLIDLKQQLEEIKSEEKRRGEAQGKKRVYFKEGSEEYERKQFLKAEIKKFESEHEEYQRLKQQIADIKQQISGLTNAPITYDAALGALFVRISDIINDLLRNVNLNSEREPSCDVDFSVFGTEDLPYIKLNVASCSMAELDFFNATLKECLCMECEKISETYILELITLSANAFKTSASADTEEGRTILDTLRTYWNYKHNKVPMFEIPQHLPVFCSMMAFFIKPFGFDQMERYMLNRNIVNKQYGFMLWGAAMGYAALPNTFTNMLYNDENIYHGMDEYLLSLHKNIELQRPCNQ